VEDTSATTQGEVNTSTRFYGTRALYRLKKKLDKLLARWIKSQQMFEDRLNSFAKFNNNLRIAHDTIDYVKEFFEKDTAISGGIGITYICFIW